MMIFQSITTDTTNILIRSLLHTKDGLEKENTNNKVCARPVCALGNNESLVLINTLGEMSPWFWLRFWPVCVRV